MKICSQLSSKNPTRNLTKIGAKRIILMTNNLTQSREIRKYARQHCVYAIAGFLTEIKSLGFFANFEIKLKSLEFLRATAHTRNRWRAYKMDF